MITPEMAEEELMTPPDYEEVQALDINYALLRKTVREALAMEEDGAADSEDIDTTIGSAIADHAEQQLEIFDLDVVEDDDSEPVTAVDELGEMLATLIDAHYDDAVEGINEIADVSGLDAQEVINVIAGQMALAPEALQAVADHFFDETEEGYEQFLMVGQEALEEAMGGVEINVMDESDDMEPMVDMSAVTNLQAEFEVYKERDQIGSWMRRLEKIADELHVANILTPAEHNSLLRSDAFRNDVDSVAVFCNFARGAGSSPQEYLAHVEFCLNWKAQCGASNYGAFFSEMTEEPIEFSHEEANFVDEYRSRNGYE